jgi:hypothetical protein
MDGGCCCWCEEGSGAEMGGGACAGWEEDWAVLVFFRERRPII